VFTVATINVAGLRGATITGKGPRTGHGLQEWFAQIRQSGVDVIAFQETKVNADQMLEPLKLLEINPDDFFLQEDQFRKGHAGVGLWINPETITVSAIETPLESHPNSQKYSFSGRWLEAELSNEVTVVSAYFHHAESPTSMSRDRVLIDRNKSEHSMNSKHFFMDASFARIRELLKTRKHLIVMGDINIAHHDLDLKNFKGNKTKAGFLPEERAWLDLLLHESDLEQIKKTYSYNPDFDYHPPQVEQFDQGFLDMHDVSRELWGPQTSRYTWWTNMGHAFDNDAGWRIDYQFVDAALAQSVISSDVHKQTSFLTRFSDHAPLVNIYKI
jgi:exodeoxyribonuclease-3